MAPSIIQKPLAKILIAEDDKRISAPVAEDLLNQNYLVDIAGDGLTALRMTEQVEYDLLLLDIMLPKMDGIELCRTLRSRGFAGHVLMITARSTKEDKIYGLDSGADDYLTKPFDIDELTARVRARVRRNKHTDVSELSVGALKADLRACTISFKGNQIYLTATEYRLLVNFMRNPRRTFSKNQLVDALWLDDDLPSESVIKAHIRAIRQKLEAAGCNKNLVETVYGFGYRLNSNDG